MYTEKDLRNLLCSHLIDTIHLMNIGGNSSFECNKALIQSSEYYQSLIRSLSLLLPFKDELMRMIRDDEDGFFKQIMEDTMPQEDLKFSKKVCVNFIENIPQLYDTICSALEERTQNK